ncbi:hypothetical protein M5K25_003712 [Dendrobium thyrsiflorum]|uniref:Uncharacterized protein n=1 Tax=Dendrobium thyrsiflorum TaxID=117978 RepID=A0ABD0VS93_DENTH
MSKPAARASLSSHFNERELAAIEESSLDIRETIANQRKSQDFGDLSRPSTQTRLASFLAGFAEIVRERSTNAPQQMWFVPRANHISKSLSQHLCSTLEMELPAIRPYLGLLDPAFYAHSGFRLEPWEICFPMLNFVRVGRFESSFCGWGFRVHEYLTELLAIRPYLGVLDPAFYTHSNLKLQAVERLKAVPAQFVRAKSGRLEIFRASSGRLKIFRARSGRLEIATFVFPSGRKHSSVSARAAVLGSILKGSVPEVDTAQYRNSVPLGTGTRYNWVPSWYRGVPSGYRAGTERYREVPSGYRAIPRGTERIPSSTEWIPSEYRGILSGYRANTGGAAPGNPRKGAAP